ncbi:PRC-barrel domain-containing protein [Streptomyces sp. NBC_01216]|uniref:PRC-barrel domain-containing protein n=1 Tax=unclassified Streptomyces TaxID=2593676 RepID=UPI002E0E64AC|nr:PRC-barrel domain-containing protein [Streptomyces sp. NBC_01216]
MLFSEAAGRGVVSLATAETIATIAGFAVAPSPARVAGLRLKMRGPGTAIAWDRVQSFGPDAVTVRSADRIQSGEDVSEALADKRLDPLGKRLLTETGQVLGTLDDIDFDETTGRVDRLIAGGQEYPGESLLGAGTYAVVIAAP